MICQNCGNKNAMFFYGDGRCAECEVAPVKSHGYKKQTLEYKIEFNKDKKKIERMRKAKRAGTVVKKECPWCGHIFQSIVKHQKYCCIDCKLKAANERDRKAKYEKIN